MARRNPVGRLTGRDRDVLRWTGQGGVATVDQLARRFWPDKKAQTALDRLRQLAKAGYLAMHVCDPAIGQGITGISSRLFTLTEQGSLLFGPAERQLFYIGLPSPAELRQQLLAQEAYLKLEGQLREQGAELVRWKSERVLRAETLRSLRRTPRQARHLADVDIPDAEATILTASGELLVLYIEVDGAYYGKMLWQKAASLAKAGHPVIWVCTQTRAAYIQEAIAQHPSMEVLVV